MMVSATSAPSIVTKPPDTIGSVNSSDPNVIGNSNPSANNQPMSNPDRSHEKQQQSTDTLDHLQRIFHHFTLAWEKAVIILLGIISLHNLWSATKFILVDYPALQTDFANQAVTDLKIKLLLTESIALMITTLISIIFAIRISKGQERVSRYLELTVGTLIIIYYQKIIHFLGNLDYTLISSSIRQFLGGL